MVLLFTAASIGPSPVNGQTLGPDFTGAGYEITDLGEPPELPDSHGGLAIRQDQPNTLYVAANAEFSYAAVFTVTLIRDPNSNHITGFEGPVTHFVNAPNVDGGLTFTPDNSLLYSQYPNNSIGETWPDTSAVSTAITPFGISPSTGGLAFIPAGFPGSGALAVTSYNGSRIYRLPFSVDSAGLYSFSDTTASEDLSGSALGPEGLAYVPLGSALFPVPSMAICSYYENEVWVYDVAQDGLPDTSTARILISDLGEAEGVVVDPVTGDMLFTTFLGSPHVFLLSGFHNPSTSIPDTSPANTTSFFPVPAADQVQYRASFPVAAVQVFDLTGREVLHAKGPMAGSGTIRVSNLAPGDYIALLEGLGQQAQGMIVKY
jgi:hypothetical protein